MTINSQLIYCHIIWGKTYKTYLNNIIRLQKRAVRLCSSDYVTKSEVLFQKFNILNIESLHAYLIAQTVFKFFNDNCSLPNCIKILFTNNSLIHNHLTRSTGSPRLFVQPCRLDIRKNSMKIQAPLIWNGIPEELQQIQSFPLFKRELKDYLLKTQIKV